MGRNSNRIKNRATEICESDDYQEARDDAFNDEFVDFITGTPTDNKLTEDDVQGFMDSFTFQDEDEWCMEKACGEADDWADMKYQEWKERNI